LPRRPSSDPKVDQALEALSPEIRPIALALRRLVGTKAPELTECLKWGNPVWVGRENAVVLMLFSRHVNLGFFRGAELGKTFPEIVGTGKNLRHVKVRSLKEVKSPKLVTMLRAAVRLDHGGPSPPNE
jgi:hypothetical protein